MITLKTVKRLALFFFILLTFTTNATSSQGGKAWSISYALEAQGLYEKAAAEIATQLQLPYAAEMAWLRYGWLHYLQGNYNDAVRAYRKALELNKLSLDARLGMTLPLLAQQRWQEAARHAQQIIDVDAWHYSAHLRLLAAEEGQRLWHALQSRASQLAARYPSETLPWLYLARAENQLGHQNEAQAAYQQVLIRSPENFEANRYMMQ